jgi:hypothetical protein
MDKPKRNLLILIVAGSLLRLLLAATFPLGNDEAYHTLFLRHPQASYFDHPPMLMLMQGIGMILFGQSPAEITTLAARLGSILLFAGSTFLLFRLTARWFGTQPGFLAAFALNLSAYHTVAAATFILPDAPLLFFWLLTMDRLALALAANEEGQRATGLWLEVGVAWGLAMLSKYHAVFLPLGAVLFCLIRPSCRRVLISLGPWVAVAVGLAIFSPVVWWNATHQWASFAFQSGRAVGGGFNPGTLAGAIGGQIAYLTPWIWWPAVANLAALLRGRFDVGQKQEKGLDIRTFLLCCSLPALAIFLYVAARKPVLPHWSLVGLIATFPLIGKYWADLIALPARLPIMRKRLGWATCFVLVATLYVSLHSKFGLVPWGLLGDTGQKLAKVDMTLEDLFWADLKRQMSEKSWLPGEGGFVFTGKWFESGHLASVLGPQTPVLCYNTRDSRGFADWSRPEDFVGRDGILVSISASEQVEPACFAAWFEKIEPLGTVEVASQGVVFKKARIYKCKNQLALFPYDRRVDPSRPLRLIARDQGLDDARRIR